MEELDYWVCNNNPTGTTGQLLDTRDNKVYWVTKLADGNCWMTQNLDYDIPESSTVTKVTDTSGTNGGPSSTAWKNDGTLQQYWDPGKKIASGGKLVDPTSDDDHLLVGNYYNWLAATNGTGNNISSGNATGSICPAGWQLPTSNSATDNGSFGKLTTTYGVNSTTIQQSPLYFIPDGNVVSGNLGGAGSNGYYWSSTASNASNAYLLHFNSSSVSPSNNYNRYNGYSVRCLVLGS